MTRTLPVPGIVSNCDVVASSAGGYTRHAELNGAARSLIAGAVRTSSAPAGWIRDSQGDGEVTVAPAAIPAAWMLWDFLNEMYAGVMAYNRNKHEDHRLRLRFGLAGGDVLIEEGVPRGGDPLVLAARLQNSPAAREATRALPEVPLVAVVADDLYQRVVPHGANGLQPRQFRGVTVDVNDVKVLAWLYVPHSYPPHVGATAARPAAPAPPPAQPAPPAASKFDIRMDRPSGVQIGDNGQMWVGRHE
ncbi:hypothetical protein ACFY36_31550 [Actinoplanes sp. NPDC000266]